MVTPTKPNSNSASRRRTHSGTKPCHLPLFRSTTLLLPCHNLRLGPTLVSSSSSESMLRSCNTFDTLTLSPFSTYGHFSLIPAGPFSNDTSDSCPRFRFSSSSRLYPSTYTRTRPVHLVFPITRACFQPMSVFPRCCSLSPSHPRLGPPPFSVPSAGLTAYYIHARFHLLGGKLVSALVPLPLVSYLFLLAQHARTRFRNHHFGVSERVYDRLAWYADPVAVPDLRRVRGRLRSAQADLEQPIELAPAGWR